MRRLFSGNSKLTRIFLVIATVLCLFVLYVLVRHKIAGYKTTLFSGKVTSSECSDACYLFIDGIKVETGARNSWSRRYVFESRGFEFGRPLNPFRDSSIGKFAVVYARELDSNVYTIYGSPYFFLLLRRSTE